MGVARIDGAAEAQVVVGKYAGDGDCAGQGGGRDAVRCAAERPERVGGKNDGDERDGVLGKEREPNQESRSGNSPEGDLTSGAQVQQRKRREKEGGDELVRI